MIRRKVKTVSLKSLKTELSSGVSEIEATILAAMLVCVLAKHNHCLHFSICACHPCAGAMLIFSVPLQF